MIFVTKGLVIVGLCLIWVGIFKRVRYSREHEQASQPSLTANRQAQQQVLAQIQQIHAEAENLWPWARIRFFRRVMNNLSAGLTFTSHIRTAASGEPIGEWVVAPNADARRRILYIHGGGWTAGSPQSHRTITDQLAQLAEACVFVVDYRLMPEHSYMAGVHDCQQAYRWLLNNGPDGPAVTEFMVIAGDSAGGSHTLALLTWLRDQGLPAPHGAIALSPATDLMHSSLRQPAILSRDAMLGPIVKKLAWMPTPVLWCALALTMRALPSNTLVSPLRGDLHGLVPTLIQVSESELLFKTVQLYAAKAERAGSMVELQIYPDMVHVWHIFSPLLPEAEAAFANIAKFLAAIEG